MPKPIFTITDRPSRIKLISIEIPNAITTPKEFAEVVAEYESQLPGDHPVFIFGRAPIWGYSMLVHAAHATPAVGVYEPREKGYIIVASHNLKYSVGDLILESDI
jgi:CRISPR-associated protein Csx3